MKASELFTVIHTSSSNLFTVASHDTLCTYQCQARAGGGGGGGGSGIGWGYFDIF